MSHILYLANLITQLMIYVHIRLHINIEPGLGKQVLSTQNTLVHIMAHISCSVCAIQNLLASFIDFLVDFSIYDNILDTIRIMYR